MRTTAPNSHACRSNGVSCAGADGVDAGADAHHGVRVAGGISNRARGSRGNQIPTRIAELSVGRREHERTGWVVSQLVLVSES